MNDRPNDQREEWANDGAAARPVDFVTIGPDIGGRLYFVYDLSGNHVRTLNGYQIEDDVLAPNETYVKPKTDADMGYGETPAATEKRDTFATGYQRDTSDDKPGYEMLPPDALEELALLYTEGAKKYGRSNYRKGAPLSRTCASMLRHAFKALRGDEDEGNTERSRTVRHFIATAWNALAAAQHIIDIDKGKLPAELDDRAGDI